MARAQYSLLDRYLLNVAIRRDGSSRFGKENKWELSRRQLLPGVSIRRVS